MIITNTDPSLPRLLRQSRFDVPARYRGFGGLPQLPASMFTQMAAFSSTIQGGHLKLLVDEITTQYNRSFGIGAQVDAIAGEPEAANVVGFERSISVAIGGLFDQLLPYAKRVTGMLSYLMVDWNQMVSLCDSILYYFGKYNSEVPQALAAARAAIEARYYAEAERARTAIAAGTAQNQATGTAALVVASENVKTISANDLTTTQIQVATTKTQQELVAETYGLDKSIDYVNAAKIGGVPVMPILYTVLGVGGAIWAWGKYGKKAKAKLFGRK